MATAQANINIKNKKANFLYELFDSYEAGIMLTGTEIKSIRQGKASIVEAYCAFKGSELFVVNMNITEYDNGGYVNHEPRRERKLLLNRNELTKLEKKIKEKGFSIVPISLFINDKGLAKLSIALARGKKQFDKRETIKSSDNKRDLDRVKKDNQR